MCDDIVDVRVFESFRVVFVYRVVDERVFYDEKFCLECVCVCGVVDLVFGCVFSECYFWDFDFICYLFVVVA